jgi:hypothetical protein
MPRATASFHKVQKNSEKKARDRRVFLGSAFLYRALCPAPQAAQQNKPQEEAEIDF